MVTLKERNWKIHIRRTAKHTGSGNEKEKKNEYKERGKQERTAVRESVREKTQRELTYTFTELLTHTSKQ